MTDQESGQAVDSESAAGQQQNSEQSDKHTSQSVPFTPEQEKAIREMLRRNEQSAKDRGVDKAQKAAKEAVTLATQNAEQIQAIHDMTKRGMSPQQIEDRMFLDNLKRQSSQGQQTTNSVEQTTSTAQSQTEPVDYPAIYNALDMDANDPEVIRLTVAHPEPDALKARLVDLRARRKSSGNVSAGAVQQQGTSITPNQLQQVEQATRALNDEMAKPDANPSRILELQKALDKVSAR